MSREKLARCKLAKPTLEMFHVKESLAEKTFREVEKSESFSPMKRSKYLRLLSGATLKQFNPPFELSNESMNTIMLDLCLFHLINNFRKIVP